MNATIVVPLAVALLGGGLLAAIGQIYAARAALRKSRQDEERLPAEVSGLWLGGAEKAVGALQVALDRADGQIARLEAALDRERQSSQAKDQRIQELERQLGDMRRQLNLLQTQADRLGLRIAELKDDEDPRTDPAGA